MLKGLYNKVLEAGLDSETAKHLFGMAKKKLESDDLTEDALKAYIQKIVREWIVKFANPAPVVDSEKMIAIVGPTGVGKTTTLVKIAARLYRQKKKVALATLDTYRIGAVEQLQMYANILGVHARVITSPDMLVSFWKSRQEGEYLLVDTAGRSPYHEAEVNQLAWLTQVPVETHLALSAGTKETDLNETIDRFSVVPIDRLLFTKLDETRRRGHLFSVIRKGGIKPSYFTTGQRVPEDMEEATPDRIAEEVFSLV
jgi:flagellar biosynthesis protein FlhF